MLKLSTPGNQKFSQASSLDITYGGGEANVGVSLSYLGLKAAHVTRFPNQMVGRTATRYLNYHGIDTDNVLYGGQKMGTYFLEVGAGYRSSEIVYDRAGSAFSEIQPHMINWESVLTGVDWFHWSGITPAISQGAADTCLQAIREANRLGVMVSGDVHSRKSLWQYGKEPSEVMPELLKGSDYLIGNAFDFTTIFHDVDLEDSLKKTAEKVRIHCPRLKGLIDKDREILSASHNRIRGKFLEDGELYLSDWFDVQAIVDRVGTGDAFAAGAIYGLLHIKDKREMIQFATAACVLKHTIPGDANLANHEDILALASGESNGRIKR